MHCLFLLKRNSVCSIIPCLKNITGVSYHLTLLSYLSNKENYSKLTICVRFITFEVVFFIIQQLFNLLLDLFSI